MGTVIDISKNSISVEVDGYGFIKIKSCSCGCGNIKLMLDDEAIAFLAEWKEIEFTDEEARAFRKAFKKVEGWAKEK